MKISFMTLGCPNWNLDKICAKGNEYGYDGVDFRGYLDEIDITILPEFTTHIQETKQKIYDAGLEVSAISSSINVCVSDRISQNMEEARRTIPVAKSLGAEVIRIFGGGDLEKNNRKELAKMGCECINKILELDGARDLNWLFETHDLWIRAQDCRMLLDNIPDPAFGALWDMGHTYRVGGESPSESYSELKGRIGYTHIKDAVYDPNHPLAMEDGWHYVLPGQGQLPLAESIHLLKSNGYDGWLQFEHEKRWHPELLDPEVAFPAFAKWNFPNRICSFASGLF